MLGLSQRKRRRTERRCRPRLDCANVGSFALEPRVLLNASAATTLNSERSAERVEQSAARRSHQVRTNHLPRRLTPAQKIRAEYSAFETAFNTVLGAYVQSINEQSTGHVAVSTTVVAPYTTPSSIIDVQNASVFGPEGMFTYSPAVVATATLGTVDFGTFTLVGSSGNSLIINVSSSSPTNLPVGTVLSASVPTSAQTSASSIFPSYITNSTIQLATNLVQYFNSLPIKLPAKNTPPHTPVQRGALQSNVYQSIAGAMSTSLQQLLLAIPLPTTSGSDLVIYMATADSAITLSEQQVLDNVQQIYSRNLLVNAIPPANRLGENFNSSSGSSGGSSSTSSTSSSSGTSSTTT
jgi:hypothetical protein